MNKRQAKKKNKKIMMWYGLDCVDEKCNACEFYEERDMSVGLFGGCGADYLYDECDNIISKMDDKAAYYMSYGGYNCPHFLKRKNATVRSLPRTYKEIKQARKNEEKLYRFIMV